jgi:hypothetical protein
MKELNDGICKMDSVGRLPHSGHVAVDIKAAVGSSKRLQASAKG